MGLELICEIVDEHYLYVCVSGCAPHTPGKSLLDGHFPTCDHYGNPLAGVLGARAGGLIAGAWKAAFESWNGDWKERALSHNFVKRNYQSTLLCDQCRAVAPHKKTPVDMLHLAYTNFSLDAQWTTTIRTHAEYLAQTSIAQQSPWVAVPGFSISRVCWDSAHTILLGCGIDIGASFLCDLVT